MWQMAEHTILYNSNAMKQHYIQNKSMLCIHHIGTYLYIVKSFNFIGTNSWFDDNGHVSGHLNSWTLKLERNNTEHSE